MQRIRDPKGGLIIIAHRGCHEIAPRHGLGSAPENSAQALEHCVAIGVDVMETDVRKTRDGYLVIMHDDTVDRTTNGKGAVERLSLEDLRHLYLRKNIGGAQNDVSDQKVLTLSEMLALAKGRIVLNLDVKAPIYAEVVDAVLRAGMQDQVIIKTYGGLGTAPLAAMLPFRKVPFAVIPTSASKDGQDISEVMARQAGVKPKPVAFELPVVPVTALSRIGVRASHLGVRLWVNTLAPGFVEGQGDDRQAIVNPEVVWGALWQQGVSMLQTDYPEMLVMYRQTLEFHRGKD
ncbi:glycerophosphodiester phosphodiesterase family protein [Novosphingobium umbonatum]|nr:glycerophosphodiester phosphodiesterase family protein [Novosphingobium umbonatum]